MGHGNMGKVNPAVLEFETMVKDKESYVKFIEEWVKHSWRWAKENKYTTVFKIQRRYCVQLGNT
jgi:aspartate-ammonia ligase (EC 6.3.1.1)